MITLSLTAKMYYDFIEREDNSFQYANFIAPMYFSESTDDSSEEAYNALLEKLDIAVIRFIKATGEPVAVYYNNDKTEYVLSGASFDAYVGVKLV